MPAKPPALAKSQLITPAMLRVLQGMADAESADLLDEADIMCDGGQCWRGDDRTSRKVVVRLLGLMLISESSYGGGAEHYDLNDTGRAVLRRPELALEVAVAVRLGTPFTLTPDDRIIAMSPDGADVNMRAPGEST